MKKEITAIQAIKELSFKQLLILYKKYRRPFAGITKTNWTIEEELRENIKIVERDLNIGSSGYNWLTIGDLIEYLGDDWINDVFQIIYISEDNQTIKYKQRYYYAINKNDEFIDILLEAVKYKSE